MAEQPKGDKEKLDLLKREEVRTMAKDIAKLRRAEVDKERKRIADIKVEQVKKKEESSLPAMDKAQISLAPEAKTPNISAPRPLSKKQKIIIRVIIGLIFAFLLVNAGLFLYWYFTRDEAPQEETSLVTQPIPPAEQQPVAPEPTPPLEIINRLLSFGYEVPSDPRSIDTIIIHSVFTPLEDNPLDLEGMIDWFKSYGVASHYLISQEGTIYRLVKDENIAYHAGASSMPDGRTNISLFSIGIELIYLDTAPPTNDQYQALAQLVTELSAEYAVPLENILGHQEISPTRKTDPWNFDWNFFHSLLE